MQRGILIDFRIELVNNFPDIRFDLHEGLANGLSRLLIDSIILRGSCVRLRILSDWISFAFK